MAPAYASIACARLNDRRSATRLYELLEPHSNGFVGGGPSWLGTTTHYLGLLAATLGHLDEADARFGAAERSYVFLNAKPWLARLYGDWAATLLATSPGDDQRVERLLKRAATYSDIA
jgi:hypothetical protein